MRTQNTGIVFGSEDQARDTGYPSGVCARQATSKNILTEIECNE